MKTVKLNKKENEIEKNENCKIEKKRKMKLKQKRKMKLEKKKHEIEKK